MATFTFDADLRKTDIKPKAMRLAGRIPAIFYGRGQKDIALELNYLAFRKLFTKAGESSIIELSFNNKKHPVLVHDIQFDPVSDEITHVDFIHVDMDKEVTTSIKVLLTGLAPAVKNLGGILDIQKHEIKIRCLPKDLIQSIEADVSGIVDFHTSVHVKDLKVPATIKIMDNPEDTVVTATPPRAEEEIKPAVPAEGVAAPGAEGAAAGGATAAGTAPIAGGAPAGAPGKK